MGAFAIALGSLVVAGTALFGTLVYVLTAASRVSKTTPHYAGDHNTGTETPPERYSLSSDDGDTVAHAEQASQPLDG